MKKISVALLIGLNAALPACVGAGTSAVDSTTGVFSPSHPGLATPAATPVALGRITVSLHDESGAPSSNKAVILEAADGTILSESATSAAGLVDFNAPDGAAVVVTRDAPDAHSIEAVAGVKGNMNISFRTPVTYAESGRVDVTAPIASPGGAAYYQFSIGCSATVVSATQLGASAISLPVSEPCRMDRLALLAIAKDGYGRPVAWASSESSVANAGGAQMTLGAWSTEFRTMTLSVVNAPDGANTAVGTTAWHDGQAFDTSWFAISGEFGGIASLLAPAGFTDSVSWSVSTDDGATFGSQVERHRAELPATDTIDFATDAIPAFQATVVETSDHARPIVSWTSLPASVDVISLGLGWYDDAAAVSFDSSVLASGAIGSSLRMPAVPESAVAARAPATATLSYGYVSVSDYSVAGTFEATAASPVSGPSLPSDYDVRSAWTAF